MHDIKLALRTLVRTPFVTAVAVLSLALGIGANAGIYSMFDRMLLRPLPVADPGRLVNLGNPGPKPGSQQCGQAGNCDVVFSYPMFRDLEKAGGPFAGVAAHSAFGANVAYGRQSINGSGMFVSGSYFPVLGVRPALGRLLTPADDEPIGGNFVVVLSHAYWATQLGSDPGILERQLVVNGQSMTVVGVAPEGFDGTTLGTRPLVYVPITMRAQLNPGWTGFDNRLRYWAYLFARLKPGQTVESATAAANALYTPIVTEVEAPLQKGMSERTMKEFLAKKIVVEPGSRGQSTIHAQVRTPLVLLLATTGIVLLIACANIANLLLARGANRSTEMAVRLSLGATRGRLLAQLLTESVVLALLGGVVSLLVAQWTLTGIASLMPARSADAMQFGLRLPALLVAAGLSFGTGIVFGLFPALHSTRPDLVTSLRAGGGKHSGTRAAARFRSSLVVAQIALSMALLVSAGLFVKSLRNVSRVDLGLAVDDMVTFALSPRRSGYDIPQLKTFFPRVEQELAAIPGVTGVTAALVPMLAGDSWGNDVNVEGFKREPDFNANSRYNEVGPGYFRVISMPLLSGREFTEADVVGAPKVAVVNEAFAKKFNLGRDAVGKRMSYSGDSVLNIEIVGLVKDAKYSEVKREVPPVFFVPYRQDSTVGSINFYVTTSLPAAQLVRTIPSVIARIDPMIPVENLKTMPQQVKENVYLDRMISTLSAAFALLATLLAAIGLYGVLAYSVAQRTREIGVRMALGASAGQVRRMVLRQVGLMTLVGGIIGVAGALALGRTASALLFGLAGSDPAVLLASGVILTLVALGAGLVPALRASRIEPMQALRYE